MTSDVPTPPRRWDEIASQLLTEANTRKMAELLQELLRTSEPEAEAKSGLSTFFGSESDCGH